MFYKKRVLENSAKFTGKHLCQSLFFNKVAVWSLQLCWKKRLWYRCFRVNFAKLLRAHFLTENMEVVASVILLSWLWNHVQSQQQKNKVRFVSSLRDGVGVEGGRVELGEGGVLVKEVVSVGLWMVYDIFCWLQLISDGFKWFAVLVVIQISQHIEELFLYCTHERT